MRLLTFFLLGVAGLKTASGCEMCATYEATRSYGEPARGLFAGVAEQFTHFGTVQEDGAKVANPSGQYLDSSISQIFAGYSLNDRFSLQLNLPVIYRAFKRPDELGGVDKGTVSGIGDASLIASYLPFYKASGDYTLSWNLLAGVKFPTGSSDRIQEEFNEVAQPVGPLSGIHGHDLTLGTGSYDGVIGTGIYGRWKRAFASGNLQYSIRSAGDFDYRYANDLTWSAGPGLFLIMKEQTTVALQFVVSGEHKGMDKFQGETAEDTGITTVFVGPQINVTLANHLSAQVGLDLPVLIENTALQTVVDYRIRAALGWRF